MSITDRLMTPQETPPTVTGRGMWWESHRHTHSHTQRWWAAWFSGEALLGYIPHQSVCPRGPPALEQKKKCWSRMKQFHVFPGNFQHPLKSTHSAFEYFWNSALVRWQPLTAGILFILIKSDMGLTAGWGEKGVALSLQTIIHAWGARLFMQIHSEVWFSCYWEVIMSTTLMLKYHQQTKINKPIN